MANELLKLADAQAIFDSIAKQYQLVLAAIGEAADANTFNKGADNARADVLTHTTDDSNLWLAADLGDAAIDFVTATVMSTSAAYFMAPALDFMRAIERHAVKRNADYSDVNDWMAGVGLKVHPYCRSIFTKISAEHVWPLTLETTTGTLDSGNEVADLGVYDITGSGAGTWTAGTAIVTTTYGDGLIKIIATGGAIGAGSDIVLTITGTDYDGSTVNTTATMPAGSAENTEVDVASSRFVSITSVTNTNGTSGDQITFRPRDDRAPTL